MPTTSSSTSKPIVTSLPPPGSPTGLTGITGSSTGLTGITGTTPFIGLTGTTSTTSTTTTDVSPSTTTVDSSASTGRINSSLLCYAVAAYAYKYAYEHTANAIRTTASGNDIFNTVQIEIIEYLTKDEDPEGVEKGRKIMDSEEEEIRKDCADPERQRETGKTEEELLRWYGFDLIKKAP